MTDADFELIYIALLNLLIIFYHILVEMMPSTMKKEYSITRNSDAPFRGDFLFPTSPSTQAKLICLFRHKVIYNAAQPK